MHYILLILTLFTGCSTLTTPFRDCKSMCGSGKAESCTANEWGENCQCRRDNE